MISMIKTHKNPTYYFECGLEDLGKLNKYYLVNTMKEK